MAATNSLTFRFEMMFTSPDPWHHRCRLIRQPPGGPFEERKPIRDGAARVVKAASEDVEILSFSEKLRCFSEK